MGEAEGGGVGGRAGGSGMYRLVRGRARVGGGVLGGEQVGGGAGGSSGRLEKENDGDDGGLLGLGGRVPCGGGGLLGGL